MEYSCEDEGWDWVPQIMSIPLSLFLELIKTVSSKAV